MTPAGYMFKQVLPRPSWIKNKGVKDIFSVSSCCSNDFADYINYWKHNGYWLFDSAAEMREIIESESIDLSLLTLFYFEVYEMEYDEFKKAWSGFKPEKSFKTDVVKPNKSTLHGFDVVSFQGGSSPECSPLSCNSLADELKVNQRCLFTTFTEAKETLEAGAFDGAEPGPYRIFSVYGVEV